MHELIRRARRQPDEAGFTLIELVVTVAIVGIIVAGLAGVVISYLRTTVTTSSRLNETHDVQFASAYWQHDVASIGVRSTTYDSHADVHSFPLVQSVNTAPCLPTGWTGTTVVTLAWTEYTDATNPETRQTVTVSYLSQASGARFQLLRARCVGAAAPSSKVVLARQLTQPPTVTFTCSSGAVIDCGTSVVPDIVTMSLSAVDPNSRSGTAYTATLTGERRQT